MFDDIADSHIDTLCHGHINSDRDVIINTKICNKSDKTKIRHSAAHIRPSFENIYMFNVPIGMDWATPPPSFLPVDGHTP